MANDTYDDEDIDLDLDHPDGDDLFATTPAQQQSYTSKPTTRTNTYPENPKDAEDRDALLRAELASVRRINQVIEGVVTSLDQATTNMQTVSRTISYASSLLDTWTRILSQTEHNQRLLLHPAWQGASQDHLDAQNEAANAARDRERRQQEEDRRREELAARKSAEAERAANAAATSSTTRGSTTRGRVRGRVSSARGTTRTPSAASTTAASSTRPASAQRGTTAAGRAAVAGYGRVGAVGTGRSAAARGRGRGLGTG